MTDQVNNPYTEPLHELYRKESSMDSVEYNKQIEALIEKNRQFLDMRLAELRIKAEKSMKKYHEEVLQITGKDSEKRRRKTTRHMYTTSIEMYRGVMDLVGEIRDFKKVLRDSITGKSK